MFSWVTANHVLLGAIAACAALAAWKGGWPERVGGGVNLVAALCFFIAQRWFDAEHLATAALMLDGLLAFSFLALTIRFATRWLGGAMLLQAAQFSLHSYYYVTEREHDTLFAVVNNVVSLGVIACILAGVAGAWRQSRRKRAALDTVAT